MIKFFINQKKVINLLSIFIILTGIYYFYSGQKEGFPNIGFDIIVASTVYPGASATDVDRLVTKKIVDALSQVEGKKEITSTSTEGLSTIIFQVDGDSKIPMDKIVDDIEKKVSEVKSELPSDVKDTFVKEITFQNGSPVIQAVFSSQDGVAYDQAKIKKAIKEFEDEISSFRGVALTSKENDPDRQIWIEVDQKKLQQYDLELSEIISAVKQANFISPGGNIDINSSTYSILTEDRYHTLEDIRNTILRSNNDNKVVKLSQVANVKWAYEELTSDTRIAGRKSSVLNIFQQVSGDVIKIGNKTKELIEKYSKKYPELKIFYYNDLSYYVVRRLQVLTNNATIGLALVFICLLLFFNLKVTFWTVIGIPFSFCLAVITTYSMGITLNLMSMFGFIIVIGMIVDDAIIVAENIYRRHEEGEPMHLAAVNGTREVLIPIIAITATTVAAFLPLTTLPDLFGEILGIIPIVVIATMAASFVECIFVLPGHLSTIKENHPVKKDSGEVANNISAELRHKEKRRWFQVLRKKYEKVLSISLKKPALTVVLFSVTTLGLIALLAINIPVIFFPGSLEKLQIRIETSTDNNLKQTTEIVDRVQVAVTNALGNKIKDYLVTVGKVRDKSGGTRVRDYLGALTLNLDIAQNLNEKEITEQAENAIKTIDGVTDFEVGKVQGGPPPGNPVSVEIYSSDINQLYQVSEEVKNYLITFTNLTSVYTSLESGKKEIIIDVDQSKAKLFGINSTKIGSAIRSAFEGTTSVTAKSITEATTDVDLIVKMKEKLLTNVSQISTIKVKNNRQQAIPITYVANLSTNTGKGNVERKEGDIFSTITAQTIHKQSKTQNATLINLKITEQTKLWKEKYPGVSFKQSGQEKEQKSLMEGGIKAAILSIVGIFLILTAIFKSYVQPFIIMSILPFTLLGVLIGLFLTGNGIGLMPMIGVVALIGIVVNDSLVLVDFVNRLRIGGMSKKEAIFKGTSSRLRPILMTTITTVVGVGPLAYGIGGSEPFLEPMAVALFWGLLFTTILLLLFLPACYSVTDSVMEFLSKKIRKKPYFTLDVDK